MSLQGDADGLGRRLLGGTGSILALLETAVLGTEVLGAAIHGIEVLGRSNIARPDAGPKQQPAQQARPARRTHVQPLAGS